MGFYRPFSSPQLVPEQKQAKINSVFFLIGLAAILPTLLATREFGVVNMIVSSMIPIGMVIFGPLSDYISIRYIFIITGVLMIITTALASRKKALL